MKDKHMTHVIQHGNAITVHFSLLIDGKNQPIEMKSSWFFSDVYLLGLHSRLHDVHFSFPASSASHIRIESVSQLKMNTYESTH